MGGNRLRKGSGKATDGEGPFVPLRKRKFERDETNAARMWATHRR